MLTVRNVSETQWELVPVKRNTAGVLLAASEGEGSESEGEESEEEESGEEESGEGEGEDE